MKPNNKFIELRKRLGPTQSVFAEKLGISRSTVADIERGAIGVSKKVKSKILDKFKNESGYFDEEKADKNVEMNQGNELGYNQGFLENDYYKNLKDREKEVFFTYKLLERLSLQTIKGMSGEDTTRYILREAEKLEDKTMYNYLRSTEEIQNTRDDLNKIYKAVSDVGWELPETVSLFKKNIDDLMSEPLKFSDYESFRNKRFEVLESVSKYQKILDQLSLALTTFNTEFEKINPKQANKK
jgi:transcriptional regulator with XRE-family HTH domain